MAVRRRHDPAVKAADGRVQGDRLDGRAPDRHYVWTDPNNTETGHSEYLGRGYTTELKRPGGPTARGVAIPEGAPVTWRGQVLVSRSIVDHEAEVEEAQRLTGDLEKRILKDGGVDDGLRGRGYEITSRLSADAGEEA